MPVSAAYPLFLTSLLQADIPNGLDAVNIKGVLVTAAYDFDETDQYVSDVAAGVRLTASGNLAGKTFSSGAFDAADASIGAAAGGIAEAVIMYYDTGSEATSILISYNVLAATYSCSGADVLVVFHASGILNLNAPAA
jgi:hypothetical protein